MAVHLRTGISPHVLLGMTEEAYAAEPGLAGEVYDEIVSRLRAEDQKGR